MNVNILYFGATADAASTREAVIEADEGETVGRLMERLNEQHPKLSAHKLLIAVNEEYAGPATTLKAGDVVAVFTPVSGG